MNKRLITNKSDLY